jgi:phage-related protein
MIDASQPKPLIWVGSSFEDFRKFPDGATSHMGYALYVAQQGGRHRDTNVLKGFGF